MTISLLGVGYENETVTYNFSKYSDMTDEDFYDFCQENPATRFERNPDGKIIVMPNTGGKTGIRNSTITFELEFWKRKKGSGQVFDSSTAFKFANGATRSPDAAWISQERWDSLSEWEQEKFPPIAPDFVIELMSASDISKTSQQKIVEYIENGVQLAWLINPKEEIVFIYRADGTISKVTDFEQKLSGENVLEGFELALKLLKM